MKPRSRYAAALVAGGLVWFAGCNSNRVTELVSPAPGPKFKVIATIATHTLSMELRMSATVRKELADSGWNAIRKAGRWPDAAGAVQAICGEGGVDGVLFVAHDELQLYDCATLKPAYSIKAPELGMVGLDELVRRLMRYLRGQAPLPSK
jgi:hypothetical protein